MAMKLIDETKEVACRTAEADAIRSKTGGTAPIPYDFQNGKGFSDAIEAISSGGLHDWMKMVRRLTGLFYSSNTEGLTGTIDLDLTGWDALEDINSLFSGNSTEKGAFFREITLRLPNRAFISNALFYNTSGAQLTIKTINLPNGLRVNGNVNQLFSRNTKLEVINGEIDFTLASASSFGVTNNNGIFGSLSLLTTLTIKPNSVPSGVTTWYLGDCAALNDSSLVSIANAVQPTETTKTLTLHATPKARLDSIMGTVADGFFTASATGDTALEDFIALTKGWTIA